MEEMKLKVDANTFLLIMLFGAMLNVFVISANLGYMPVKSNYEFSDEMHFSYQSFDEVNLPFFSDIIGFETDTYLIKASFGDLAIVYGAISLLILLIKFFKDKWQLRKYLKRV